MTFTVVGALLFVGYALGNVWPLPKSPSDGLEELLRKRRESE